MCYLSDCSVAGGFDNESVAVTAMCLTFWCVSHSPLSSVSLCTTDPRIHTAPLLSRRLWCRSLRAPGSWPIGLLAGAAYAYMVAAWGGFIFVGNMVRL